MKDSEIIHWSKFIGSRALLKSDVTKYSKNLGTSSLVLQNMCIMCIRMFFWAFFNNTLSSSSMSLIEDPCVVKVGSLVWNMFRWFSNSTWGLVSCFYWQQRQWLGTRENPVASENFSLRFSIYKKHRPLASWVGEHPKLYLAHFSLLTVLN